MGQTFDLLLLANVCTTSTLEMEAVYRYKTSVYGVMAHSKVFLT
jgi:hypothetical protein